MGESRHTKEELRQWQALPLEVKILMTKERIRQWVNEFGEDGVCVSFSGGKDSTVLLHLVRQMYPDVKAVFSNTGLEYPEIQRFVRKFDNTDIIIPKMRFRDVITEFGYPLIGKEVAEAIYYARKLRGGAESRQKQNELHGRSARRCSVAREWGGWNERITSSKPRPQRTAELSSAEQCESKVQTKATGGGRSETQTNRPSRQTEWKRVEIGGGANRAEQSTGEAKPG